MRRKKTGRILISALIALTALSLIRSVTTQAGQNSAMIGKDTPQFTQKNQSAWLNSKPLTNSDLSGHVTLIDFWTFGCWNCYRSFPWLRSLEKQLHDTDFQVIGIHSPEFDHEKVLESVASKTRKFKLDHPIMIDNDMTYWRAMQNRYWPAYYLIGRQGTIRHLFVGETHAGTRQARKIETAIRQLLDEAPSKVTK